MEGERDLEVVGEADNAKGVLSESRRTKPDVVLLEFGLSSGSEFDLYKNLFNVLPSVRIISLMRDGDTEVFRNAVEAGAQGYVRENADRLELIRAAPDVRPHFSHPRCTPALFKLYLAPPILPH